MIELQGVFKSYGQNMKNNVLTGVNLTIRPGESVAIMGRSGSGKSTLLNIMGGLTSIDKGKYLFNDEEIDLSSAHTTSRFRRKHIGVILQNYALLYDRNVFDNVLLALDQTRLSKAQKETCVVDILTRLGIKQYQYKNPVELSGGECQRVAIGRALVKNPDLILADEPTGALDSITEKAIMTQLLDCQKTVVIATHNLEVAKYCTRIVKIHDGVLQDIS